LTTGVERWLKDRAAYRDIWCIDVKGLRYCGPVYISAVSSRASVVVRRTPRHPPFCSSGSLTPFATHSSKNVGEKRAALTLFERRLL